MLREALQRGVKARAQHPARVCSFWHFWLGGGLVLILQENLYEAVLEAKWQ